MNFDMIFAGFGGQGILFLAKAAANAGLADGREVSWLPSYGPEMRGGTANCSVCLSDSPISSPLVTKPDVLAAMNLPSYRKFIDSVKPGGFVFLDSSLIAEKVSRTDLKVYYIPATSLAEENSLRGLANIIMLGAIFNKTNFCTELALIKGLEKSIPPAKSEMLQNNLKALKLYRD